METLFHSIHIHKWIEHHGEIFDITVNELVYLLHVIHSRISLQLGCASKEMYFLFNR